MCPQVTETATASASKVTLRVLMALPMYPYPVVGGLERQSHELAKALIELGVFVQVVSGRFDPNQSPQEVVEGILVHRIPWSRGKWLRFVRTPFDLMWVLFSLRRSYDVVHLHHFSWFCLFIIIAAQLLRKPVLTKLPNVRERGLPGLAASRFGRLSLVIFSMSDAVVAMSRESLNELSAIGYPLCRVLATPNGIMKLPECTATDTMRGSAYACRVVFVGRLDEQKGLEDLLYVWQQVVAHSGSRARLEVWGQGPQEDFLRHLSADLGLKESVVFQGKVDAVRERLLEMDVFVLPSFEEGNSNAILEAMAAGLPVVSTRVGGTPLLVGHEGEPFLVDPGDREGLYSHLMMLMHDKKLRRQVGDAMSRRVCQCFDIRRVAKTYAAAYALLADGRREEVGRVSDPLISEVDQIL